MRSDENTVSMVVNNYEPLYKEKQYIISRVPWWDDEDSTWNDIDKAARAYRELVSEIDSSTDGFTDLQDIDLDSVDFEELVIEELEQENIDAGRTADAGLK